MKNLWLQTSRKMNKFPLINHDKGVIKCPFCYKSITPQIRKKKNGAMGWNSTNFKRHLDVVHSGEGNSHTTNILTV